MVGLPNAGKSTLVSKLTTAHPKVANYQFTTLTPVLGVCEYKNERMVFADIPGLIEGASEGKGLGHEFLRHIERCSILIHMISLNPDDNMDINEAYDVIMSELKLYQRQIIIVFFCKTPLRELLFYKRIYLYLQIHNRLQKYYNLSHFFQAGSLIFD